MGQFPTYTNVAAMADGDEIIFLQASSGETRTALMSVVAPYIGAEFTIASNVLTLPDGRTFSGGITALAGLSVADLPTTEPSTANILWNDNGIIKVSGQRVSTLTLESENAGTQEEPVLDLYRNSSTPSNDDRIGGIQMSGNDADGNKVIYGGVEGRIVNTTTDTGTTIIQALEGGNLIETMEVSGTGVGITGTLAVSGAISASSFTGDGSSLTGLLVNPTAGDVDSESSTDGFVLTSDGSGGAAWEAAPGSGGGETNVQADWNETTTTDDAYILNKPRIQRSGDDNIMNGALLLSGDLFVTGTFPDQTPAITEDVDSVNVSKNVEVTGSLTTQEVSASTQLYLGSSTSQGSLILDGPSRNTLAGFAGSIETDTNLGDIILLSLEPVSGAVFSSSSTRFNNDYTHFSKPIRIGANAAANEFDDYEEGTWTPTADNFTATDGTTDFSSVNGRYTKIGNIVHLRFAVILPGSSDQSVFIITGFPFTPRVTTANPVNQSPGGGSVYVSRGFGIEMDAYPVAIVDGNGIRMGIGDNVARYDDISNTSVPAEIIGSITYETDL